MANANGDLMSHSIFIMGIIIICIYLAIVLVKMAVEKIGKAVTGRTGEQRKAEKIMAKLEKEEEEEKRYREEEKKQGDVYESHSSADR